MLSAKAYAELNQLIKNANENAAYICDVAGECHEVLEAEPEDIFLFFTLGQNIEQLDRQIRLKQDQVSTLEKIDHIVGFLHQIGWNGLDHAWQQLKSNNPFSYFTQIIYYAFLRRIAKEKKQSYIKGKLIQDMPFELFETQEQDDDREFHNQYMEFMQQNHQLDDFIERKAAKRKKKQPNLDDFLGDEHEQGSSGDEIDK